MAFLRMFSLVFAALVAWSSGAGPIGYNDITCGSTVKMIHVGTKMSLKSQNVQYGTGSGQQTVTLADQGSSADDYWQIRAAHGKECKQGARIKCGATIRLSHVATHKFLHSHTFRSPLSQNQEVSAFAHESGEGDSGDNWKVECSGTYWQRDAKFKLRHVDTKAYLHSTGTHKFNRPIAGQREVCAIGNAKSGLSEWTTGLGYYIKPAK